MKAKNVIVSIAPDFDSTPVAKLVQLAGKFNSQIYIISGTKHINAKSIMGMMSLALNSGDELEITADGPDEDQAIAEIESFITK